METLKQLVDGYKYNFETNTWTEVAPVVINGKEVSVLGANSVKLNESEMMVIGGFEKQLWNDANYYLGNLKGEELANYKAGVLRSSILSAFNENERCISLQC